jgi:hypothetical protein
MRLIVNAAACLCLFVIFNAHARAQNDLQETRATFVTYVSGQEAARESYTFAPQPDGTLRAAAEITPAAGAKQKLTTVATRAKPVSFSAESREPQAADARPARRARLQRDDDRLRGLATSRLAPEERHDQAVPQTRSPLPRRRGAR